MIPVNQEGVDRSAIKALIRVLNAGNGAADFPEGSRTLDGKLAAGRARIGLGDCKNTRASRPDANLWRARSPAARRWRFALCPNYDRHRRTDLIYRSRPWPAGKNLYQQLSQRVMDAIARCACTDDVPCACKMDFDTKA